MRKGKNTSRNGNNSRNLFVIWILIGICLALWLVPMAIKEADKMSDLFISTPEQNTESEWQEDTEPEWQETEQVEDKEKEPEEYVFEEEENIIDSEPPTIILEGDLDIWLDSLEEFIEPGFKAEDNIDGEITQKVETEIITEKEGMNYKIEYSVKDSSQNIGKAAREIRIRQGMVYLTFDDGPSLEVTPPILDILERRNVKATFFVVGYSGSEKEALVKREAEEGHTIGLHGFSHDYEAIYNSLDDLMENFAKIQNLVEETTGVKTNFIRFPGGASNTISANYCKGIMSKAVKEVEKQGFIYFDWNVDSDDAGTAKTADEIYQNVIDGIKPGRTNVVLMHDSVTKQATVDALERIIDYCEENDFELRAIDENTTLVQHRTFN